MPTHRIGGIDYEYLDAGEGPPLVLVGEDPASFAAHVEALQEHHRCVAIGLFGPDADPLIGVVDALGVGRAVYVGHDIGREAAVNVASEYPEEIAALVLAGRAPQDEGEFAVPTLRCDDEQVPLDALKEFLGKLRDQVGTTA